MGLGIGSLLNVATHVHKPVVNLSSVHSLRVKARPNQNALNGLWRGYCRQPGSLRGD